MEALVASSTGVSKGWRTIDLGPDSPSEEITARGTPDTVSGGLPESDLPEVGFRPLEELKNLRRAGAGTDDHYCGRPCCFLRPESARRNAGQEADRLVRPFL